MHAIDHAAEQDLWRLATQGNVESYAQLRQLYRRLTRSLLQRYISELGQSDLEDLEQEVWIAVWKGLPRFEGRCAFTTWLTAVTKNVASAWLRRKRNNNLTLLRFAALDNHEIQEAETTDPLSVVHVHNAVDRLSRPEHQVIELRYFRQLTDREIAGHLRLPLGTVKGRIRAGLTHLREGLPQRMWLGVASWVFQITSEWLSERGLATFVS